MPNPYQTLGRRTLAYLVDSGLWLPALLVFANPFMAVAAFILLFLVFVSVAPFYRVFMLSTTGTTIGKLMTGLSVVRASDLGRPGILRILVRESPHIIFFLPLVVGGITAMPLVFVFWCAFHLFAFVWTGLSAQDRSMMDRLAGTVVVRRSWLWEARQALARGEPVTLIDEVSLPVTQVVPPMPPRRVAAPRATAQESERSPSMPLEPIATAPLATVRQRLEAFAVDAAIVVALLSVTLRAAGALPGYRLFLAAVITWLTVAAYTIVMQQVAGSTLGKRHCGIAIVTVETREPIRGYAAFLRGAPCLFAGLLPSLLLLGVADTDLFVAVPAGDSRIGHLLRSLDSSTLLMVGAFAVGQVGWLGLYAYGILFGAERQSLGDRFAQTIVVYHPQAAGRRPMGGVPTTPR